MTALPYEAAAALWLGLSLAAYVASVYLLGRELGRLAPWRALAIATAGLAWQPVRADLGFGNVNCVLLLLLTGTWLAARRRRAGLAGVILALSILVKPVLGPVVLLFVLRRHWRAVASCAATVALGYGAALAATGPSLLARYLLDVLPAVQRYYQVSSWNISAWTIGWRVFHGTQQSPIIGGISSTPLVASPVGVAVAAVAVPALALALACLATRRLGFDWAFGLMIATSVMVSPTAWTHYLVLLAVPAALTVSWLVARRLPWRETTLTLAVGALLVASDHAWASLAVLLAGRPAAVRPDLGDVLAPVPFAPALLTVGPTLALGLAIVLLWALGRQAGRLQPAIALAGPAVAGPSGVVERGARVRGGDLPAGPGQPAWAATAGVETLRRMASVDQYNRWIFQALGKHIGRRILEVGCGIGNMTPFFLAADALTCIDAAPEAVEVVRRRFAAHAALSTLAVDVADPAIVGRLGPARYDTAICINVLEHGAADAAALRHLCALLRPGGKVVLFVPAGQYLYGHLDEALGHYRRYTVESLRALARAQGLAVLDAYYMNVAGIPGWFVSSRLLRREAPPRGLLWLFNLLAPALAWTEEKLRPPFGLSVVCIAQRPEAL